MTNFTHKFILVPCFLLTLLTFGQLKGQAQQIIIRGTVYNMYRTKPLEAVSVMSTSGRGTATDSVGHYEIAVAVTDSISFSYLGKATAKYPVSTITGSGMTNFDIALHVDPVELKEIKVMPRNYSMDSLQNRQDYAKYFNFKKPGFKITGPTSGLGAGVDLDELINVFRFQRTKRLTAFQNRLEEEEQDKYVDHRFSKYIVKKITHLDNEELDTFMMKYRPSYEFCKRATDYDFFDYIKLAFKQYQKSAADRSLEMKKENE